MALSLPDPTYDAESTRRLYPSLPIFEGFPYLVTRVVPAMYHGILLPADASELELVLLARTQWRANRLEVCLVIGEDRAWFYARKLNANYYDARDGQIWRVPGFCGFRHRCPNSIGARDDEHMRGNR